MKNTTSKKRKSSNMINDKKNNCQKDINTDLNKVLITIEKNTIEPRPNTNETNKVPLNQEKIKQLKEEINKGSYNINSVNIAKKIITEYTIV